MTSRCSPALAPVWREARPLKSSPSSTVWKRHQLTEVGGGPGKEYGYEQAFPHDEVFRARFRTRTRRRGESYRSWPRTWMSVVHKAYPGATPAFTVLLRDQSSTHWIAPAEDSSQARQGQQHCRKLSCHSTGVSSLGQSACQVLGPTRASGFKATEGSVDEAGPKQTSRATCCTVRRTQEPRDVKLQLEGEESLAVYVADMEDACILGLDYLLSAGDWTWGVRTWGSITSTQAVHRSRKQAPRRNKHQLWSTGDGEDPRGVEVAEIPEEPEGQLARWLDKLEQHQYTIIHRPGLTHGNADSLSRHPCLPECRHCHQRESDKKCRRTAVEEPLDAAGEELRKLQREDRDLRPVVEWLSQTSERPAWEAVSGESPAAKHYWPQWDTLRLEDGVLQRCWTTLDGLHHYWLTVLPMKMRAAALEEMHNNITSGHLG
ncbi:hypothetical protein GWK47_039591 [Chionoecetes opilio]|uniref:Integrase zinc-binding domain-containing protein n=1 Tax=Chionoecetes opilio TaxID=41210 RepID=A0A8J5CLI8_CHIOP|nr:hypothetical protein GWK47_039591 [Chionoecetes opilio]